MTTLVGIASLCFRRGERTEGAAMVLYAVGMAATLVGFWLSRVADEE